MAFAEYGIFCDAFDDLGDVAKGFEKVKDDNITRGMVKIYPILKPFRNLKFINKFVQKMLIFRKK